MVLTTGNDDGDAILMRSRDSWAIRDSSVEGNVFDRLGLPKRFFVPITVMCVLYCLARLYILVEDLMGLRSLPKSAFDTVEWSKYIPHL